MMDDMPAIVRVLLSPLTYAAALVVFFWAGVALYPSDIGTVLLLAAVGCVAAFLTTAPGWVSEKANGAGLDAQDEILELYCDSGLDRRLNPAQAAAILSAQTRRTRDGLGPRVYRPGYNKRTLADYLGKVAAAVEDK